MKTKTALAFVMAAGAGLVTACAGTKAQVSDEQLARVPAEQRSQLIEEEHAVRVAETNVQAAKVAAQDADKFKDIVDSERDGAKARMDATSKSLDLAARTGDRRRASEWRDALDLAGRRLSAVDAKLRYADELEDVRDAQVDLREAEVDVARARLEQRKHDAVARRMPGTAGDRGDFQQAIADADRRLMDARERVRDEEEEALRARQAWHTLRGRYNSSIRGRSIESMPEAPEPPESIAPIRVR